MELSNINIVAAFFAGVISFLSPCVLPLVPGYVSYVAGYSIAGQADATISPSRLQAAGLSLCFILGFSTIFVLLGASATTLGQLLRAYQFELNIVGGIIIILFGLLTLGILQPLWSQREFRLGSALKGGRPTGAYLLGTAFAFGWTPCIGPILGAILTVSAVSATVSHGVTLLSIYSLGLGIPFVLAALFTNKLLDRIKLMRRAGRALKFLAGGMMILVGAAMITGYLSVFSFWLLQTFPMLGFVG